MLSEASGSQVDVLNPLHTDFDYIVNAVAIGDDGGGGPDDNPGDNFSLAVDRTEEEINGRQAAAETEGTGHLVVVDHEGNEVIRDSRIALCRCGASKNKPFCDGTHSEIGFPGDGD